MVVPFKPVLMPHSGQFPDLTVPLLMEQGWLVGGHHRLAAAIFLNYELIPIEITEGILDEQRAWHQHVRQHAAIPGNTPHPHKPTPPPGSPAIG